MEHHDSAMIAFNVVAVFVAWVAAYTGVPPEPAVILGVLMVIDTFVGVCAAWRIGENITSRKLTVGIIGKFLTMLIPLTVALVIKATGENYHTLLNAGVLLLVISEGYSVLSNIHCYRKGVRLPEMDVVSVIAGHIRNLVDLKK